MGEIPLKAHLELKQSCGCIVLCHISCKSTECFDEDLEFLYRPGKIAPRILLHLQNGFGTYRCKYHEIFLMGPLQIRLEI